MRRAYDRFVSLLEIWSAVLLLVMLGIVLFGVVYRYLLDSALSWYDEFAGFTLVWLTMYGSVVALAKGKHIGFETLVEKLPPSWHRAVELFRIACVMAFSAVMVVYGWQLIREMSDETAVSLPWVKMAWVYSVLPITGALMLLVGVAQLVALGAAGASGAPAARPKAMEEAQ